MQKILEKELIERKLTIAEAIDILHKDFPDVHPKVYWESIREKFNFTKPSELDEKTYNKAIECLDNWGLEVLSDDVDSLKAQEICLEKTVGYVNFFNPSKVQSYRGLKEFEEDKNGIPSSGVTYYPDIEKFGDRSQINPEEFTELCFSCLESITEETRRECSSCEKTLCKQCTMLHTSIKR